MRVKPWVAFGETPLLAVSVIGYVPPVPAAGVPLSKPVEVLNVIPVGRLPLWLKVGVGMPVVVTLKEPAEPTVNMVLFVLVIAGA